MIKWQRSNCGKIDNPSPLMTIRICSSKYSKKWMRGVSYQSKPTSKKATNKCNLNQIITKGKRVV
jgi:hypothetical protein